LFDIWGYILIFALSVNAYMWFGRFCVVYEFGLLSDFFFFVDAGSNQLDGPLDN